MKEKILVPRYVQYIALPLSLIVAFWFTSAVRTIVIIFALSFIIALVLDQPVTILQTRLRFPRVLAVVLVWLILLGAFAGLVAFFVPNVISELNQLIEALPGYTQKVEGIAEDVQSWFRQIDLEITPSDVAGKIESGATEIARRTLGFVRALFDIGLNIFLTFVISIYMLIDTKRLKSGARRAVPEEFRGDAELLFSRMQKALGSFLRGQLVLSALMGILGGIIAWYGGGGRYVFLIAIWVGITEVIPLIGPFLGMAPAVGLAWFAVSPMRALIVAILFIAVQQLEGHILVPRIMGKSVGVHPLWVMFAVLSGATLGGIMGALFAVPLVAIIKVTVDFYREEMVLEKWQRPLLEKTTEESEST